MMCVVVYDVPDDAARLKVAETCLDYGLERIQYSTFLGEMSTTRQVELLHKVKRRLAGRPANVQIFPLCERDLRLRKVLNIPKTDG
jgi:CRISPR-associated protein Cas2